MKQITLHVVDCKNEWHLLFCKSEQRVVLLFNFCPLHFLEASFCIFICKQICGQTVWQGWGGSSGKSAIRANNALWVPFLPPLVDTFQCIFIIIRIRIIIILGSGSVITIFTKITLINLDDFAATKLTCFSDPMGDRTKGCDKTKGFKTCFVRYDQGD